MTDKLPHYIHELDDTHAILEVSDPKVKEAFDKATDLLPESVQTSDLACLFVGITRMYNLDSRNRLFLISLLISAMSPAAWGKAQDAIDEAGAAKKALEALIRGGRT